MLPDVHDEDLTCRKREKSTLPLKVLVLTTLPSVRTLDIHDEDVVGHLGASALDALVLGHPDTLCSLTTLGLGHDGELGAEEMVEQGRFSGGLRAKDGDEVVVEASFGYVFSLEVSVQIGAEDQVSKRSRN